MAQYPRDRVALNDLGRIYFLQRRYQDAVTTLKRVLAVDPEDLQANYNLMLCYNGLGNEKMAKEHETRYLRFKADESAQTITGPYRQLHPEDNNERQPIHEHVSVPLPALGARTPTLAKKSSGQHSNAMAKPVVRPAERSALEKNSILSGAAR
jgi:tetratricopeptide (TPR) repeat protein